MTLTLATHTRPSRSSRCRGCGHRLHFSIAPGSARNRHRGACGTLYIFSTSQDDALPTAAALDPQGAGAER